MMETGKILLSLGLAIALIGALLWGLGRAGFHGLPGDVRYESRNVRVYFPIVTCIAVSILLTLGMWLWRWIRRP